MRMKSFAAVLTLLLSAVAVNASPQQVQPVSGRVISLSDNEPLIGVSVVVKGTSAGVITDIDGNYTINVESGQTLVFSYIGFMTEEVKIGSQRTVNVSLHEDAETLDEVVVIGYGVQKKKLLTGATVQVSNDDLMKMNATSPLGALQSQTPGVNITQNTGEPGAGFKVTVRGLGTVGDSMASKMWPRCCLLSMRANIWPLSTKDVSMMAMRCTISRKNCPPICTMPLWTVRGKAPTGWRPFA